MMTISVESVSFSCPTIAPKHYIVKGPSGWTETFDRKTLDDELARFISPAEPRALADVFVTQRAVADKPDPVNWHTIVGFLGRVLGHSPRAVPATVGIAFWAHVELFKREQASN
jgi:hypothetical protein